jgi:hypothetical protein
MPFYHIKQCTGYITTTEKSSNAPGNDLLHQCTPSLQLGVQRGCCSFSVEEDTDSASL